eukprot:TRINITY_DN2959_c0_g1_i2.p1 TRINITY_DN2959_c0_g1~~TRINITY_DN2959_c0_g1_i2.p1  ORF type:complete len:253 (+),score=25.69 TRINITY_DN2959_c0_g1_i2:62-820(+)
MSSPSRALALVPYSCGVDQISSLYTFQNSQTTLSEEPSQEDRDNTTYVPQAIFIQTHEPPSDVIHAKNMVHVRSLTRAIALAAFSDNAPPSLFLDFGHKTILPKSPLRRLFSESVKSFEGRMMDRFKNKHAEIDELSLAFKTKIGVRKPSKAKAKQKLKQRMTMVLERTYLKENRARRAVPALCYEYSPPTRSSQPSMFSSLIASISNNPTPILHPVPTTSVLYPCPSTSSSSLILYSPPPPVDLSPHSMRD